MGKESIKNLGKNRGSDFRPTQTADNMTAYEDSSKKGGSLAQLQGVSKLNLNSKIAGIAHRNNS